ncbi:FAD-dependent monooxygenase [Rhizohabitans arisaemae]|uniref:FAD-dependent monooxygenase n=1 Tax=Rhizohabitans arisaemae TaxID=2720610 RepID=UPI0024B182EC|nr:FAD-dependent monooxygenase [Rhizohabitans arisaemae]
MFPQTTQVLVVGGGLVGLSMSAFLSWHGVDSLTVERRRGLSTHPRARGINPRTMELLRVLGLEERVLAAESARALAGNSGVIAAETLAGPEVGELRQEYFMFGSAPYAGLSPSSWCMCHQDELEPLLRGRAAELGGEIRLGVELTGFEQDSAGVRAVLRDASDGEEHVVHAEYLIAADGAGSPIRRSLGIPFDGAGTLGHFVNIQFEADLRAALGDRRFIMCYLTKAGVPCALLPVNNADRWMLHVMTGPDGAAGFTEERCRELVRAAAGLPELEVAIKGALPWESAGRVAERFGDGRVFLVGDAAHVMPPTGAFGSNTGIQDAHNLAWKLAAVLRGQAGAALLGTYDAERRPVAEATVTQAVLRSRERPRIGAGGPPPAADPAIVSDRTVVLGQAYDDGAWEDVPSGRVGTRAPHVALADGRSTIDLFRRGFTLLTGPDDTAYRRVAGTCAAGLGVPLACYVVEDPSVDKAGATLVRPDGFVAWRSGPDPVDPARELGEALAHALRRTLPSEADSGTAAALSVGPKDVPGSSADAIRQVGAALAESVHDATEVLADAAPRPETPRVRVVVYLREGADERGSVEAAYGRTRDHLEGVPGLYGDELLKAKAGLGRYLLVMDWANLKAFTTWEREHRRKGHPSALRPFQDRDRPNGHYEIYTLTASQTFPPF